MRLGRSSATRDFTYTAEAEGAASDEATVTVRVFSVGTEVERPQVDPGEGWAKNDADTIGAWRSGLIRVDENDEIRPRAGPPDRRRQRPGHRAGRKRGRPDSAASA